MIRAAHRGAKGTRSGFTLLELMVVLAVLALLVSLALPGLRPPSGRVALITTARDLAQSAAQARAAALNTGRIVAMDINLRNRTMRIAGAGEEGAGQEGAGQEGGGEDGEFDRTLPGDLALETSAVHRRGGDGETARFLFFPGGQSSGGDIILTRDGQTARIRINWVTGHAAVSME